MCGRGLGESVRGETFLALGGLLTRTGRYFRLEGRAARNVFCVKAPMETANRLGVLLGEN
jgi:hypothetical protein